MNFFWRFCMFNSNDTFDKNKKYWSRDKANISNPKINRGRAPLTANRTSADCVQISLGPSIPYIPLGVYHTGRFNPMGKMLVSSRLPFIFINIYGVVYSNGPFQFRWLRGYIHSSCYHHKIGSINLTHYHIFPWLCAWDVCYIIFCHLLHMHSHVMQYFRLSVVYVKLTATFTNKNVYIYEDFIWLGIPNINARFPNHWW